MNRVVAQVAPTARAMRWWPLVMSATVSAGLLIATALTGPFETAQAVVWLRLAALALCVGVALLLDDDAAATVEPVPTRLLTRRAIRVGLAVPAAAAAWAALVAVAGARSVESGAVPGRDLTIEFTALLAVTFAVASIGSRHAADGKGGVAAGPAVLALAGAAVITDRWLHLYPMANDPHWDAAGRRWATILALAVVTLVWASLDPGRARQRRLQPVPRRRSRRRLGQGGRS